MKLTIISGAIRPVAQSNTAKLIAAFRQGFDRLAENTSVVYYLSDRAQWQNAKAAFDEAEHILFVLPLYVEGIPDPMLEFLEGLTPKTAPGSRISFLLQGGFPEASQSRCCEAFVETLPEKLGCAYGGTAVHGDCFGLRFLDKKTAKQITDPFEALGRGFGETGNFLTPEARAFGGPEYLSRGAILRLKLLMPVERWFMTYIAKKKMGCKEKLDAAPYVGK